MSYKKTRWSNVYESSEEELLELLQERAIDAQRTHLDAGTQQSFVTETDTKLWCAEGSLVVTIASDAISLQPGDVLTINASTACDLAAGFTGCAYYLSK